MILRPEKVPETVSFSSLLYSSPCFLRVIKILAAVPHNELSRATDDSKRTSSKEERDDRINKIRRTVLLQAEAPPLAPPYVGSGWPVPRWPPRADQRRGTGSSVPARGRGPSVER